MSKWAEEYFGSQLQTKEGTQSTSSVLNGKARVGIYFSAHWVKKMHKFFFISASLIVSLVFIAVPSLQRLHTGAG